MSELNIPLTVVDNNQVVGMEVGAGVINAVSPTVDLERVSTPNPGLKVTVKDVRGEHSETVLDGPAVDPSALIDDTSTAVNKVWSAHKSDDEITSVKSDLDDLSSDVNGVQSRLNLLDADDVGAISKPSTPGTSGQVLVSDGNGRQVWGATGQGTIVVDNTMSVPGAAADAKKAGELIGEKAPVIVVEKDAAYYHEESPFEFTLEPEERASAITARYAGSKNLLSGFYQTGNYGGVNRTRAGRFTDVVGTSTGGFVLFDTESSSLQNFAGKTYHFYLYTKKSTAYEGFDYWQLRVNNNSNLIKSYSTYRNNIYHAEITFPETVARLALKFNDIKNAVFVEGDCYWWGMYEIELIDTENTVDDESYTANVSGVDHFDSALHQSTIKYKSDTKKYVDDHTPDIIGYWSDNVYAMPEKFGAVGDGVVDDATALANCLAYAAQTGKAVRGYGKYKTSVTLAINWQYADVYLREIIYTGNNSAVEIQHMDVRFEFHRIQSSGVGITFSSNSDASPKYARRCVVKGNEIASYDNCVYILWNTLYNTCEIRYLNSQNANCIEYAQTGTGFQAQEYVFRSSSCTCPNGYAIKRASASKFYDFTIESNCKYGLFNPGTSLFYGFRHREQTDAYKRRIIDGDTSLNNGALIVFTGSPQWDGKYGLKYITSDAIPYFCIDVSAIKGYDPVESGEGSTGIWQRLAYNGIDLGSPVCGVDASSRLIIAEKVFFIGNNKVFVPGYRSEFVLTREEYDMTLFESNNEEDIVTSATYKTAFATDYITGAEHTDFYMNASYGAVGYNDITLTQVDGYTATFYDKLGNVLFDGTNEGDGKWRFTCKVDRESMGRLQYSTTWWCYDGTNEKWEITKIG